MDIAWFNGAGNTTGHILTIHFHKWILEVNLKDNDKSKFIEDITIYDANGADVTEEYLIFNNKAMYIRPTGINLYYIMDTLMSNLKSEEA